MPLLELEVGGKQVGDLETGKLQVSVKTDKFSQMEILGIPSLIALCAMMMINVGCGPSSEVQAIEEKARSLVAKRASTNDVIVSFGRAPIYIDTRAKAIEEMLHVSPDDLAYKIWQRLSGYPQAYSFPMPGGEVLLFFDDSGRATGFYSNIQL